MTDRELINEWLDMIGETDHACRDEVLAGCAADKKCRAYFVKIANAALPKAHDKL
jgi:hypothetical protein